MSDSNGGGKGKPTKRPRTGTQPPSFEKQIQEKGEGDQQALEGKARGNEKISKGNGRSGENQSMWGYAEWKKGARDGAVLIQEAIKRIMTATQCRKRL